MHVEPKLPRPLLAHLLLVQAMITKTLWGQINLGLPRLLMDLSMLLLDLFRLHLPMILTLIAIANKTLIELFRRSFRPSQRVDPDLKRSSRPKPRTSTVVGPTWSATTLASNVKTILPLAKPPGQTEFRLQPFFAGSNQLLLATA